MACSFLVKIPGEEEFRYYFFPGCLGTAKDQFVVKMFLEINADKGINVRTWKEKIVEFPDLEKDYVLKFTDGVSIVEETHRVFLLERSASDLRPTVGLVIDKRINDVKNRLTTQVVDVKCSLLPQLGSLEPYNKINV